MAKILLRRGGTSNIIRVFLQDATSPIGAGKTGLNNTSTGLIISAIADVESTATAYTAASTSIESIATIGTYQGPTGGKCRFKEVDAVNFPGVYEIHLADTRFSVANSTQLIVCVQATGVVTVFAEFQFTLADLLDSVRLGLSALPNVASGSAGAIITSGTGTAQLSVSGGSVTVGTINANAINAASIATNAIDADAIASDAVTEIQSGLSTLTAGQVENAVWDATMSSHTGSTTYGGRVIRAVNSNVEAFITGAHHIAADIHELQPAVINNSHFATGAIDSTVLAANAINSSVLATNAAEEIADTILGRNLAGGSSGGRTVTEALRFLRNKFSVVGTTLTVYQEDDTTTSWTGTVGTTIGADPITSNDPA